MLKARLDQLVSRNPGKIAIRYGERQISYQDFLDQVESCAKELDSYGIKAGDCVTILLSNRPEFIVLFFAIVSIGGIVSPINHLFTGEEIRYYLDTSAASVVITDRTRALICQEILPTLRTNVELIVIEDSDDVLIDISSSLSLPSSEVSSDDNNGKKQHENYDGIALYQYTSGTTGRPKRVSRTHKNLLYEVNSLAATAQISSEDNILCVIPLCHAHGLGNCLLAAICNGATLTILEEVCRGGVAITVPFLYRVSRVLELIEQTHITIFPAVPYVFNTLAEASTIKNYSLDHLRLCFSAGNFLEKEVFDKFLQRFGIPVRQLYGCTEAGAIAVNLSEEVEESFRSVGSPLKDVIVRVVDEEGNGLPTDEVGEISIESGSLTKGYDNNPVLSKQAFQAGTFLTGDLGHINAHGLLHITGRKKNLIDTGGRKVDPTEIEDIILAFPKVEEVVVIGTKQKNVGELIKSIVVLKNNQTCSEKELFAHCQEHLASFKVPRIIEFRDQLPKSPLGKILRRKLT